MPEKSLKLNVLPTTLAICRLRADASLPSWAQAGDFSTVTYTADELSIVCPQDNVPDDVERVEASWRCLQVAGPLDFSLTGVLAALAAPLAQAGISIFAISTYDTDYVLVKEVDLANAIEALSRAGHWVKDARA